MRRHLTNCPDCDAPWAKGRDASNTNHVHQLRVCPNGHSFERALTREPGEHAWQSSGWQRVGPAAPERVVA